MASLLYVFLILLVAVGPARAVPLFAARTAAAPAVERRRAAIAAVAFAAAVFGVVICIGLMMRRIWSVPWPMLSIAAGLFMLPAALRLMSTAQAPSDLQPDGRSGLGRWSEAALGEPIIVTPCGIVVLLLFSADGNLQGRLPMLAGLLSAILALDLAALLSARRLMRAGVGPLLKTGVWLLAPLLAILSVQSIVIPVTNVVATYLHQPKDADDDADDVDTTSASSGWSIAPPASQPGRHADLAHSSSRAGSIATGQSPYGALPFSVSICRGSAPV